MSCHPRSVALPASRLVAGTVLAGAVLAGIALAGCSAQPAPAPSDSARATATAPSAVPAERPSNGTYAIDCTPSNADPGAVVVLSPDVYRLGGWNHVNGVGAFETVRQEPGEYKIGPADYVADASCEGAKTLSVLLARKTYDWDRQHANGMETTFPGEKLTFGAVDAVVLELRVDPETTYLPTAEEYAAAYGDVLTAEELAAFDDGNVVLEVTLFGSGATGEQPFMNASALVSVDPEEFADGWVRVQVPRADLEFYTESNYARTPVGGDEFQDLEVRGLRVNPEVTSRSVARTYIGDAFDPAAKPELFKEMGVTFALIEIMRLSAPTN